MKAVRRIKIIKKGANGKKMLFASFFVLNKSLKRYKIEKEVMSQMIFSVLDNCDRDSALKVERLFEKYRKLMFGAAFEILQDKGMAEDAVIAAMERIIKNIDKIGEIDCPKTRNFVVIICKNAAIDIYNKRKTASMAEACYCGEMYIEENEPINIVLNKDTVDRMKKAIKALDMIYRDVFLMKYAHKMSREEIAEACGISIEAVKKRLARAKRKIVELMGEEDKHE